MKGYRSALLIFSEFSFNLIFLSHSGNGKVWDQVVQTNQNKPLPKVSNSKIDFPSWGPQTKCWTAFSSIGVRTKMLKFFHCLCFDQIYDSNKFEAESDSFLT